jgi:hypothetical protein
VPELRQPLLEQAAHQTGHCTGDPSGGEETAMVEGSDLHLTAYTATHRVREHHEDGYVDVTGKKQKKWRGWYHVYASKPDGSRTRIKRKRVIGPCSEMTKAEAKDEHRAWIRRFNSQPVAESGTCSVANLCDDFMAMREGDWDETTRKTNRSVFNSLIKPALGEKSIAKVEAEHLKKFLNGLPDRTYKTPSGKKKTGVSQSYVKKAITHLRGIFDLAEERGLINKNPARSISVRLTVPKQAGRPDKSVFPPQFLPKLIAQLDPRDSLVVWLAMVPALRPGELFAVRGGDVGSDYIYIQNALTRRRELKDTKTGKALRRTLRKMSTSGCCSIISDRMITSSPTKSASR